MSLMEQVSELQNRLADAERQRARAEGARDNAKAAYEDARTRLKTDFGVDTLDEAIALLDQLRAELADIVQHISGKLDEIGI